MIRLSLPDSLVGPGGNLFNREAGNALINRWPLSAPARPICFEPFEQPERPINREPLPGLAGKGSSIGGHHASVLSTRGLFGRALACCDHATVGAGTRTRWIFGRLFERHGGGENQRAGALLRARQRPGRALSGRCWPGR